MIDTFLINMSSSMAVGGFIISVFCAREIIKIKKEIGYKFGKK